MNLTRGNIWSIYSTTDALIVTTNAILSKGRLIMGAGAAKQARDKVAGIDKIFGEMIADRIYDKSFPYPRYGFLFSEQHRIGALQTKYHFNKSSPLSLIHYSIECLLTWCSVNPDKKVDMVFPGIGYGGLNREDVLPLLGMLPDQVTVWEL